jgi:predicted transcriptional regulator
MTASTTFHLDPALRERLDALAAARHMDPIDLLTELIAQAETDQLVSDVNRELERLAQGPQEAGQTSPEMRRLDATVRGWMDE